MTKAADDVLTERGRQQSVEGWTQSHDDLHTTGDLAKAAACYAIAASWPDSNRRSEGALPLGWPWEPEWFKPTTRRHDLVKAGALILAEIERLDRIEGARDD